MTRILFPVLLVGYTLEGSRHFILRGGWRVGAREGSRNKCDQGSFVRRGKGEPRDVSIKRDDWRVRWW